MSTQTVTVEIMKRQFSIGAPASERETLLKAVEMLNQKITAIQSAGRNMENEKVVMMAALNLTHDLLKTSEENAKKALPSAEDTNKIRDLIALCDNAVKAN